MSDTVHIKEVVQKAIDNAAKAGLGFSEQNEHALRALHAAHPELGEAEILQAISRIRQRPMESPESNG